MTWALWVSFATVSALNIVTPGPANLNTVRRAVQLGARRVLPTILGNALGLAVGAAICAAGIASFVMASGILWAAFRWLGIVYLAWLGLKLIVTHEDLGLSDAAVAQVPARALFTEAFCLALTNPKALLFYLALFPQVLDPAQSLAPQAGILILTYCGLSVLSLGTYSALAQALSARLMTQARYTRFRHLSGALLMGFAVKLYMDVS